VHALTTLEVDIAPVGGEPYSYPNATNGREILEMFDRNCRAAREAITRANEEHMAQPWTLSHAGKAIFTMTRSAVVRQVVLNHIIHHRAILCGYLRLNDIRSRGCTARRATSEAILRDHLAPGWPVLRNQVPSETGFVTTCVRVWVGRLVGGNEGERP
jgi:uncharacterized damage-inducible protein DinB